MAQTGEKPRGAGGKFISENEASNVTEEDLPNLISKSSKMTGALKDLKEEKEKEELEKPLVTLSVNNPISWFMKVVNNLKKKQTTTFTFRLGIPLIALPIFIGVFAGLFFGLGKITTKEESPLSEIVMSRAGVYSASHLVLPNGDAIKLVLPEGANLEALIGKRILVSGIYNQENNTLKVENITDMELLPKSPEPLPSPIPTTTATSAPPSSQKDVINTFYNLISEGNITEAVETLSSTITASDSEKQSWGVMFNSFESIEVVKIENSGENKHEVTLNIKMKPGSEHSIPNSILWIR